MWERCQFQLRSTFRLQRRFAALVTEAQPAMFMWPYEICYITCYVKICWIIILIPYQFFIHLFIQLKEAHIYIHARLMFPWRSKFPHFFYSLSLLATLLSFIFFRFLHYDDVIMTMLASQIISLTVVYSIVYSGVKQRKHQISASLAFVREIHRGPVNFPHKWPVTRKMFPFDDVIMLFLPLCLSYLPLSLSASMSLTVPVSLA